MKTDYQNFVLLITESPTGYQARVISSPVGDAATVDFTVPRDWLDVGSSLWQMGGETRQLGPVPEDGPGDPELLGRQLYDTVFSGAVGASLIRNLEHSGDRLRIVLRLDNGLAHLAALPWEFLYSSHRKRYLALSTETPLVRYLEVDRGVREVDSSSPPLVVLGVISNPRGLPPLAVAEEWQRVQEAVTQLGSGRFRLEQVDATWSAVQSRLQDGPVHVVHFIGHGLFDEASQQGALVFENKEGDPELVSADKFKVLLNDQPTLQLVFLNACEGAEGGRSDSFAGVAQQLVQQGVPAVVAMQFPVTDRAALVLSQTFYTALTKGYPIDAALGEARKAVFGLTDSLEWATPVLFMRNQEGNFGAVFRSDTPPPPEPMRPPVVDTFVGRRMELEIFSQQLETEGLVVVAGMPGIGKTSFAAQLVKSMVGPEAVFWHTFHHGEDVQSLIWKLAAFLAWHGTPDLWQMLQELSQSGGQMPPATVLVDYVFQLLRGKQYLICLDEFHLLYDDAEDDPLLQHFMERIRSFVEKEPLQLAIVSRSTPRFLTLADVPLLAGLTIDDTRTLLAGQKVELPDDLFHDLYSCTEGNVELLMLAAHSLQKSQRPERVIQRLVESDDIERFLLREVDQTLDEEERAVMNGVAVLLGQPGPRDAIEEALDGRNVRRTLSYLSNRYLILTQEGEWDREYLQHAIVQAFYYEMLQRRERREMHSRVAAYYEEEEENWLQAARHYALARDPERAAELAVRDLWVVVNQGQANVLRALLVDMRRRDLDPLLWMQVQVTLGQLHKLVGNDQDALACYTEALETLADLDASADVDQQRAYVYRLQAELTQQSDPRTALAHVGQGLAMMQGSGSQEEAALLIIRSSVLLALGEFADALDTVQTGLDLLPTRATRLRMDGLLNLASLHSYRGDLAESAALGEEALALAEASHDVYRQIGVLSNLAIDKFQMERRDEAVADNRRALALVEHTGSRRRQAELEINLGYMLGEMGDLDAAERLLTSALAAAQENGQREFETIALTNLGSLRLQQKKAELAGRSLAQAEELAEELGLRYLLPEITRHQAEVALSLGDRATAEERIRRAIALTDELDMPDEQSAAEQVLTQI